MLTREQIVEKLLQKNIRALCRDIGISPATIYRIINGKPARRATMYILSEYLSK